MKKGILLVLLMIGALVWVLPCAVALEIDAGLQQGVLKSQQGDYRPVTVGVTGLWLRLDQAVYRGLNVEAGGDAWYFDEPYPDADDKTCSPFKGLGGQVKARYELPVNTSAYTFRVYPYIGVRYDLMAQDPCPENAFYDRKLEFLSGLLGLGVKFPLAEDMSKYFFVQGGVRAPLKSWEGPKGNLGDAWAQMETGYAGKKWWVSVAYDQPTFSAPQTDLRFVWLKLGYRFKLF